jgi:hypothetical protein
MLLMRIVAYNISLLWSSCLGVTLRIYKHSAPPEGCGQAAPCINVTVLAHTSGQTD